MPQKSDHDHPADAADRAGLAPGNAPPADALKPAPVPVELKAAELRAASPLGPDELIRMAHEAADGHLLGQARALDAIRLAINIDAPGYNIFVSGLRTREERDSILRLVAERAALMPTPGDWIYVN